MSKVLKSKPPLVRIQRIAAMLSEGKHLISRKIAERLEVNKKTIDRDIDFMRDQLDMPIETDGSPHSENGGYYFTGPVTLCRACCRPIK